MYLRPCLAVCDSSVTYLLQHVSSLPAGMDILVDRSACDGAGADTCDELSDFGFTKEMAAGPAVADWYDSNGRDRLGIVYAGDGVYVLVSLCDRRKLLGYCLYW